MYDSSSWLPSTSWIVVLGDTMRHYQNIGTLLFEVVLSCLQEDRNPHDSMLLLFKKSSCTVGHIPWRISTQCYMFLRRGGTISSIVMGTRRYSYDLGMKISCKFKFSSACDDTKRLQKIKASLTEYLKDEDHAKNPIRVF